MCLKKEVTARFNIDNRTETAVCPVCSTENVMVYDEAGAPIWWPNSEKGRWCIHCAGVYQGYGRNLVFIFH